MTLATLRDILFWSLLIHAGLLIYWAAFVFFARPWVYSLWSRWFRLTSEQFDAINLGGLLLYKLLILVFVAVPYLALLIVGNPHTP